MEIDDKAIRAVMADEFGFEDFKSREQQKTVEAVLGGVKNLVVSMATNSGKSLCFQIPS